MSLKQRMEVKHLSIAKQQGFDAVISDVNMPVMDGITLIRELRTLTKL